MMENQYIKVFIELLKNPDNRLAIALSVIAGILLFLFGFLSKSLKSFVTQMFKHLASLFLLLTGKSKITKIEINEHKSKFPKSKEPTWYKSYTELVEALTDFSTVVCIGANGSGRTQIAISALKKIGFPNNANDEGCSYVPIDAGQHENIQSILAVIMEATKVSYSSEDGILKRIERIKLTSQTKYCSILIKDIEKISDQDREFLEDLLQNVSTRFKIVLTSSIEIREFSGFKRIQMKQLDLNDIRLMALNERKSTDFLISDIEINTLIKCTNSHFFSCHYIIKNSGNKNDFEKNLQELSNPNGILFNIVKDACNSLSKNQRRAIVFIARFGGKSTWNLLRKVFENAENDIDQIHKILESSPVIYLTGDIVNGHIEIVKDAKRLIEELYRKEFSFIRSNIPQKLIRFFNSFDEIKGQHQDYSGFEIDRFIVGPFLKLLIKRNQIDNALDLYKATCELMFNRGFFEQRISIGSELSEILESHDRLCDASWVISTYSSVKTLIGQPAIARIEIEKARDIAITGNCQNDILRANRALAATYYREGKEKQIEAKRLVTGVINDANSISDRNNLVDALYLLICINMYNFDYDDAEININKMIFESEQGEWYRGKAYAVLEKAKLLSIQGNFADAKEETIKALSVGERYSDLRHVARCKLVLGKILMAANRKIISREFATGQSLVDEAQSVFFSLKMDNELIEAQKTIKSSRKNYPLTKMAYEDRHSDKPIGGD